MVKQFEKKDAAALRDLAIEWRLVNSLIPRKNNPRTHSKKQSAKLPIRSGPLVGPTRF
jgi:hypothetical protein